MTGRARIYDRTRIQHVWELLQARPATCITVWLHLRQLESCTHTAVDKTLRDMVRKRYLTRTLVPADRGQRQYLYAAHGNEPPTDGRVTKIPAAVAASVKARKDRVSARIAPVDPDDDADDNWGRGRCAKRTGTPDELPGIPSLADLLAR
jgi:hypothetical protein